MESSLCPEWLAGISYRLKQTRPHTENGGAKEIVEYDWDTNNAIASMVLKMLLLSTVTICYTRSRREALSLNSTALE